MSALISKGLPYSNPEENLMKIMAILKWFNKLRTNFGLIRNIKAILQDQKLTFVGGLLSLLQKLWELFHKPFDWQIISLSPFNVYPMGHDKEHFDGYVVWEHWMVG